MIFCLLFIYDFFMLFTQDDKNSMKTIELFIICRECLQNNDLSFVLFIFLT